MRRVATSKPLSVPSVRVVRKTNGCGSVYRLPSVPWWAAQKCAGSSVFSTMPSQPHGKSRTPAGIFHCHRPAFAGSRRSAMSGSSVVAASAAASGPLRG